MSSPLSSGRLVDLHLQCTSPAHLTEHINEMHVLFSQPESEHNWEKFAKSLAK